MFLLLALPAAGEVPQAAPEVAAERCLPGDAGYLSMRLRGSIDAELDWREPQLACTGMSRPGGQGLRIRFSGPLVEGNRIAILFAASNVGEGESARGVPVNVTVLDESGGRIFGTRGDHRCTLDSIEQSPLAAPRSFRVEARGFCTDPPRALDGQGAVLLSRFDFTGQVTYREDDGASPDSVAGSR